MKFDKLLSKQLSAIQIDKKLNLNDLRRIAKYVKGDIFGEECCKWTGKMSWPNELQIYLNGTRVNLQRLLYINFVSPLTSNQFLKRNCSLGKRCICLAHMKATRFKVEKSDEIPTNLEKINEMKRAIVKPSLLLSFE